MNYEDFLKSKQYAYNSTGFEVSENELNSNMFDFQKAIVKWALKKGKCALFLDTGLGKTICQLEFANQVCNHENGKALILAPLAVSKQTKQEGEKFGINVNICRSQADVKDGINITNYEMLSHFDVKEFCCAVLDESSILKSFSGKYKKLIIDTFENTKYKLSCTATPSPNNVLELLNQAEFLSVMKSNEALAIWFVADQNEAGAYRLKHHAEDDFWKWISSWAVLVKTPSELGFDDSGYVLPPLNEIDEIISVDMTSTDSGRLLRKVEMSATSFYKEKKILTDDRVTKIAEIVNNSNEQFIIWCNTNEESAKLHKAIAGSVEVKGSDKPQLKEDSANKFKQGDIRVLISKVSIFGYGLNFQNCTNCVFCGLNYSYEGYYQAVRRLYRFGQTKPVTVYRVIGTTERSILRVINDKYAKQLNMQKHLNKFVNSQILDEIYNTSHFIISEQSNAEIQFPSWLKSDEEEDC